MFFLFKQKTAYEMRISDWSSDVCSSDQTWSGQSASLLFRVQLCDERLIAVFGSSAAFTGNQRVPQNLQLAFGSLKQTQPGSDNFAGRAVPARSEEHTSELQSLMRISYAVFCLKKKIYKHQKTQQH